MSRSSRMAHTRKPRRRRTDADDPTGRYRAASAKGRKRRSSSATFGTCVTALPGVCGRCGEPVPLGTRVRFLPGRNRIWHFKSECGMSDAAVADLGPVPTEAELAASYAARWGRTTTDKQLYTGEVF